MEKEIELKLLLPQGIDEALLLASLGQFSANIETSEYTLFNQYFDTPDWSLSDHSIGLRVRSSERGIEQTVKTAGKSVGGLHQRPEYNVQIDTLEPNLSLFDEKIWPESLELSSLQNEIVQIFHTDFRRQTHLLRLSDGTDVELVLDQGQISTAENNKEICEIELELKKGNVEVLFDLAEKVSGLGSVQLCNISKAGRGFLLAKNTLAPEPVALQFVEIQRGDTCEQGFVKALEYCLSYWQLAEYRYMQRKKIADLVDVYKGLRITSECINFYSDILALDELQELRTALNLRLRKWVWIEQLQSIKSLRSRRGMYSKKLTHHDALINYLRGLQDGTLNLSRPDFLITHKDNSMLQLQLSRLLVSKPWHDSQASQLSLRNQSTEKLETVWQLVFDKITGETDGSNSYFKGYEALKTALFTDVLVGKCFSSTRRQIFRAPWQDVLEGIEELKTLKVLQTKLQDSDVEDKTELLNWCEVKKNTILSVIKQSKAVALEAEIYW